MIHWEIALRTRAADGTAGTHTFVVVAESAWDARRHVLARAEEAPMVRRRRGAALDLDGAVVATPWRADPAPPFLS